ncbi:MAG: transcription antitermination factor NusB [Eubacteriales bacterium]
MLIAFYDAYSILAKVYSDKAFLKQAILATPIEEKNRALTIKTCYGVLDKDIELSYYIAALSPKNPKLAVRVVLKIAMYNIKYLHKHPYAVIDNAVELVKKLGKGGVSGYVNALLRRFSEREIPLPEDKEGYLSVKYSFPAFAVKRLVREYGEGRAEEIMSAEGGDTTLAFYESDGAAYLAERGIKYRETPFENAFTVKNFVRNADYDAGVYTFQSVGSLAVCAAVDGGESLLDACAAPGGKSVNLSRRFRRVTACEVHPHRAALIEEYARRMKRENIEVFVKDATVFDGSFAERFDAVLCDAPCSGFGVAFENPDIKLNKDEGNLKELVGLQGAILQNCSRYVKKGGYLYYSTCSFFGEENSSVAESFLKNNPDFALEELSSPLAHEKKTCGLQFLPDVSGGGFFIAKMRKKV